MKKSKHQLPVDQFNPFAGLAICGDAEDWATAFTGLATGEARLNRINGIMEKLRALRTATIKAEAVREAVSASTRVWSAPAKDDFVEDVTGETGSGNNGQTDTMTERATDFYNEVTGA